MIKTRHSVFETNSSSTHSINIVMGALDDTIPKDSRGIVRIFPGEFGWNVEDYTDAASKASYCLTFAANAGQKVKFLDLLERAVRANVPDARTVVFEKMQGDGVYYPYGYIDHQSEAVCAKAFKDVDTLSAFIFCKESTLHTDNDNR